MGSSFMFTYTSVFGEFSLDTFDIYQPVIAWFYFILETLIVLIVLLNLLISIVGDSFKKVNENQKYIMFLDIVEMIVENGFLLEK